MPTLAEAFEQARGLATAGQLAEAEAIYRQLVAQLPDIPDVWGEMGLFYLQAGRPDAAIGPLEEATQRHPQHGGYHSAQGAAARLLKRRAEAVTAFRAALAMGPPSPELYNNLALALKDDAQYEESLANFEAALALRPDYQTGHFNRGNVLLAMGRPREALSSFRRALELLPNDAGAWCSLGLAHFDSAELDPAMEAFQRALTIQPNYPEVLRNQALVWFLRGDYRRAWPAFESRLACDDFAKREHPQPRWDGSSLAGKTLYVYAEQGLGDVLQFARYLPLAAAQAKRVWFEPHEALRPLLVQSGFDKYLVAPGEQPAFDVHASLLSLAGHLPDERGEPFWPGPYLQADPRLVAHWRERLRDVPRFKVGIAWAGNPEHPHDRFRSTRVAHFAPLAALPGVQLVSVQHGPPRQQLAECSPMVPVLDLADAMDFSTGAFMDRAAVIENLDLVITVDTAVAHVAAALGKPVWVALQYAPDWRWRSTGETTPWYPSMRLFRQADHDDWPPVFARIARELAALVQA
ncbi:MAG: tetratricopeptide repeat protein [Pirellulales bacterium]